jgi:mevalonate kinase
LSHLHRKFPAKILLFGEHVLLKGAQALAIPVPAFYGEWRVCDMPSLQAEWKQLKSVADQLAPTLPLDFQRLRTDISLGVYFGSNIPQGYGLGSSGALCAAIYSRYVLGEVETDLLVLKGILGKMESCFHGKSSGIDPLTSYLDQPLLIGSTGAIHLLPELGIPDGITVFLADTQQARQTGGLVSWFLEQYEQPAFSSLLEEKILPAYQTMLQTWLAGDSQQFMLHLQTVSQWQLQHLHPMLPVQPELLQWWAEGVAQGETVLKICGAGGGGFVLGFTIDPEKALHFAQNAKISLIFPFNSVD